MVANDAAGTGAGVPRNDGLLSAVRLTVRHAISDKEVDAIMNRLQQVAAISRGRKLCLNRVKWFVLTTVRSQTLQRRCRRVDYENTA